jgi:hypothetical protein
LLDRFAAGFALIAHGLDVGHRSLGSRELLFKLGIKAGLMIERGRSGAINLVYGLGHEGLSERVGVMCKRAFDSPAGG